LSLQIDCRKIVGGIGKGTAIVTTQQINFLSMVDTKIGTVNDQNHELFGRSIKGCVLVFPNAIGSSVGAYAIYSLKANGVAPAAIVCTNKVDITTASGCAIASIPLVNTSDVILFSRIKLGLEAIVDADNEKITVIQTV
jgi:phosphomecalonate degydratase small subunit